MCIKCAIAMTAFQNVTVYGAESWVVTAGGIFIAFTGLKLTVRNSKRDIPWAGRECDT